MQTVILAGGLGTRLGSLTKTIPKPMVTVRGVPYLEHQFRLLAKQKLTRVLVLSGYLGDHIEQHFGDGRRLGLQIRYSRETHPLGTGGALRAAEPWLDDLFLILYGDSYLPIEYRNVSDRLAASSALGVIAVYRDASGETSVPANVALDDDGYITKYDKQRSGAPGLDYIEAGVLAFRRSVIGLISPARSVSLESDIYPQLIARRALIGMLTSVRFWDIGTPQRLREIEEFLT